MSGVLVSHVPGVRGEATPSHSDSDSLESANLGLFVAGDCGWMVGSVVEASLRTSCSSPSSCSSVTCCFLHFILRFWNQVLTCVSLSSRRPANSMRSGTLKYFFSANLVSSPSNCFSVNTVLSFLFLFMRCPRICDGLSRLPAFLTISLMTATGADSLLCMPLLCNSPSRFLAKLKCAGVWVDTGG